MIGYATLGTNDIERARAFYSELLGSIGAKELMRLPEGFTMYGVGFDKPGIAITTPYDGQPHDRGNGQMLAIPMDQRARVNAFHAKALELGGTCEGAPGLRGDDGPQAFYAAYLRDPDGNKLCAFKMGPEG
jgi:catechol 2,3-dioxygenase-like lactoylglutathione lyase family enzyme